MKTIEWGVLIVNYLFLGGLSAGLLFVAALATLLPAPGEGDPSAYSRIGRYGALAAPWPVMIGCLLLVFDLGNWNRFYLLFLHFRWTSPMSIGSWLLVLFNTVALLFCFAWLTAEERERLFACLPRRLHALRRFNRDLSGWLRPLAVSALPLSVGVGIYTGVLLGAVQSRPFWNTNLVAQLFLVSALSTGSALLMLICLRYSREHAAQDIRRLVALDVFLLTLEFFIVIPYLVHGQLSTKAVQDSLQLILGGPFTVVFWVFFLALGLLLPLALEIRELLPLLLAKPARHSSSLMTAITAVLVLGGGLILRVIFVYAGQMSAFE
jgi:formate-dependent nitrite reductase membrane component NrfD